MIFLNTYFDNGYLFLAKNVNPKKKIILCESLYKINGNNMFTKVA